MAEVTLTDLLISDPVTTSLTGDEPVETVVSGTSEASTINRLSFAGIRDNNTTAYTIVTSDQGRVRTMSNSEANVVTLPSDADSAFPINGSMVVRQIGTGATSFVAGTGASLQYKNSISLTISERFGQAVLHKIAANTWHICGELEAL